MTLQIDLTPEEEACLQQAASRRGMATMEYVRDMIRRETENDMTLPKRRRKPTRRAVPEPANKAGADVSGTDKPKTGAELVAYLERAGVFGTFADRGDSQEFARELRRQAESRR